MLSPAPQLCKLQQRKGGQWIGRDRCFVFIRVSCTGKVQRKLLKGVCRS